MIIYVLPGCAVLHVQGIFFWGGGGLKMYVTCNISFSMQLLFETLLHQGRTQQYIKKNILRFSRKTPKISVHFSQTMQEPRAPQDPH